MDISIDGAKLDLDTCPHCGISKPVLAMIWQLNRGTNLSLPILLTGSWRCYCCSNCGCIVLAGNTADKRGTDGTLIAEHIYPSVRLLDKSIPTLAHEFLRQALWSRNAPAGAVMLCSSAIDAMLKSKGYRGDSKADKSLYVRINKAAEDGVITQDVARWAHQVRLEANEPRHADEEADTPSPEDAQRCIEFSLAFAEILFVLPARVTRGLGESASRPPAD